MFSTFERIGIVGAGAMGRGIAQIAAQAGCQVLLLDSLPGVAEQATKAVHSQWTKLAEKGKLSPAEAQANSSRLPAATALPDLAHCDLIVEAVIEDLATKRALMKNLMDLTPPATVLATNTSSLSITAIAAGLDRDAQVVGFHFFNPVPLMRVVEVIPGLKTSPEVVQKLERFAKHMGHTPVVAHDTPGFIVNHAGRAYGTEALRVLGERVADIAAIGAVAVAGGGEHVPKRQLGASGERDDSRAWRPAGSDIEGIFSLDRPRFGPKAYHRHQKCDAVRPSLHHRRGVG